MQGRLREVAANVTPNPLMETLLSRALLPGLRVRTPAPLAAPSWNWDEPPQEGQLQGPVFVAACVLHPNDPWRARGGMAVAQLNAHGQVVAGAFSPVPGPWQLQLLGEIWAAAFAVARRFPPIRLWTTCKALVEGYSQGPEGCTRPMMQGAEAWKQFWFHVQDTGQENVEVKWLQARGGLGQLGAQAALQLARAGCACHPDEPSLHVALQRSERVLNAVAQVIGTVGVYRHVSRVHDVQVVDAVASTIRVRKERTHRQGTTRCRLHVIQLLRPKRRALQVLSRSMPGVPPEPPGCPRWPHPSHHMWHVGLSARFCGVCGCFTMGAGPLAWQRFVQAGCGTEACLGAVRDFGLAGTRAAVTS